MHSSPPRSNLHRPLFTDPLFGSVSAAHRLTRPRDVDDLVFLQSALDRRWRVGDQLQMFVAAHMLQYVEQWPTNTGAIAPPSVLPDACRVALHQLQRLGYGTLLCAMTPDGLVPTMLEFTAVPRTGELYPSYVERLRYAIVRLRVAFPACVVERTHTLFADGDGRPLSRLSVALVAAPPGA